jgi:hypothetical protein
MEWTLCLVGIGIDDQSWNFEVMAISRPDDLGDIGLTLVGSPKTAEKCSSAHLLPFNVGMACWMIPDFARELRTDQRVFVSQ